MIPFKAQFLTSLVSTFPRYIPKIPIRNPSEPEHPLGIYPIENPLQTQSHSDLLTALAERLASRPHPARDAQYQAQAKLAPTPQAKPFIPVRLALYPVVTPLSQPVPAYPPTDNPPLADRRDERKREDMGGEGAHDSFVDHEMSIHHNAVFGKTVTEKLALILPSKFYIGELNEIEKIVREFRWDNVTFEESLQDFIYPNLFDLILYSLCLHSEVPAQCRFSVSLLRQDSSSMTLIFTLFRGRDVFYRFRISFVYPYLAEIFYQKKKKKKDKVHYQFDLTHRLMAIAGTFDHRPFLFSVHRNPGSDATDEMIQLGNWMAQTSTRAHQTSTHPWTRQPNQSIKNFESHYSIYKNALNHVLVNRISTVGPYTIRMHAIHWYRSLVPYLCEGSIAQTNDG